MFVWEMLINAGLGTGETGPKERNFIECGSASEVDRYIPCLDIGGDFSGLHKCQKYEMVHTTCAVGCLSNTPP